MKTASKTENKIYHDCRHKEMHSLRADTSLSMTQMHLQGCLIPLSALYVIMPLRLMKSKRWLAGCNPDRCRRYGCAEEGRSCHCGSWGYLLNELFKEEVQVYGMGEIRRG